MNILNTLTSEELRYITKKSFKKGEIIFYEGELCKGIGVVANGEIEIATLLSNGEKVVYTNLKTSEIFGSNLLFSSNPFYKGDVVAVTDSEIYLISEIILKKILRNNDDFLNQYLRIQGDSTIRLNHKIKLLSIPTAKDRVLFSLENSKNNALVIKSITTFAEQLGLTREATSRAITSLIKKEKIIYKNKRISKK